MSNKRGQQKISFGMIFSIILIILFISFAAWGVYKLINLKKEVEIEKFPDDLQDDVDELWKGSYGEQTPEPYSLPKEVDMVCFVKPEYGKENLELIERREEGMDKTIRKFEIEHVDIEGTIGEDDRYCIDTVDNKVGLTLIKDQDNPNVIIERSGGE